MEKEKEYRDRGRIKLPPSGQFLDANGGRVGEVFEKRPYALKYVG
jgi:hypothetical protein